MITRIFLANQENSPQIEEQVKEAKEWLSEGKPYPITWSCGSVNSIQIGDRVYFKKSGDFTGYFAFGRVVVANRLIQLRGKSETFKNLSETYCDFDGTNYYVRLQWESVVDYDQPLLIESLKNDSRFAEAFLDFCERGQTFKDKYVNLLDDYWDKHCLKLSKQGKGVKLADVYYERGQQKSWQGLYVEAIADYNQAIQMNDRYHQAFYARGLAYAELNQYKKAVEDFNQTLCIDPLFAEAYYSRSLVYSKPEIGDNISAIEDLEKAAKLYQKAEKIDQYQKVLALINALTSDIASQTLKPSFY